MSKLSLKNHEGFTIIEVVIVLAIAALIIVIVLLAVAGLQRSQRTKAMQDAAGRLLSQVVNYESDNGGQFTIDGSAGHTLDGTAYITNAKIPTTIPTASVTYGNSVAAAATTMRYGGGPCNTNTTASAGSATSFAVSYWSETAGAAVCINN